jgi:hypothetical protein
MFIIPFIHRVKHIQPMQISTFQILTIGGILPWKEDDSMDLERDILEPNGIYLDGVPIKYKNAYLCPIDTEKTNMNDFYKWSEISVDDTETFCWRTFYVTGEKSDYCGWLPIPPHEMLGPHQYKELFDIIYEYSNQVI